MKTKTEEAKKHIKEVISSSWVQITDEEFERIKNLVYSTIGINLTDQKRTLLMGRLQKVLRQKQFKNFEQYYDYVVSDKSGEALAELANNISTNHTFFYRENRHFEFFIDKVLPEILKALIASNSKDMRIWSAGCSSGEEPYTLIMLMMEAMAGKYVDYDAGILATDISKNALTIAQTAVYGAERIKYLPKIIQNKYFEKSGVDTFRVIDKVKKEVTFRRFNLMNKTFPFKKKFHTIFCRNVMIYFDDPTRTELVRKFYDLLVPGGYLFIGHSESLNRIKHDYKPVIPAVYQKI